MSRILVVDDSEVIGKLLQDYLGGHGFEVVLTYSGGEAFKLLKTQTVDLILLDIQLPDLHGFEFCKIIRNDQRTRNVPVIIITATATQTAEKVKGLQQGADDYIVKPFEMDELLERVRAVMRRRSRQPAESTLAATPVAKLSSIEELAPEPVMPMGTAIATTLCTPFSFPSNSNFPHVALGYVLLLILTLGGSVIQAPGLTYKPILVCVLGVLYWGLLVSTLVVTCTFLAINMKWKEGARLMSLALIPVLMKLISGYALAATTALSPFLFTAGPALYSKTSTFWIQRLDAFEMWSAVLVFALVFSRKKANFFKAFLATLVVVGMALFLLMGLQQVIR